MTPGKVICIMLIATALAVATVWQCALRRRDGYRLDELQQEIAEHRARRTTYRNHISKLRNPRRLTELAEQYGLELQRRPPQESVEQEQDTDTRPTPNGEIALDWSRSLPPAP